MFFSDIVHTVYITFFSDIVLTVNTQKQVTSKTDLDLIILSSKTYVFEDKLTKYNSICLIISFSVFSMTKQ